jgi:hypothetical protein
MGCCGAKKHEAMFVDLKRMMEDANLCKDNDIKMLDADIAESKKSAHVLVKEKRDEKAVAERLLAQNIELARTTLEANLKRLGEEIAFLNGQKQIVENGKKIGADANNKIKEVGTTFKTNSSKLDDLVQKMIRYCTLDKFTTPTREDANATFLSVMSERELKLGDKFARRATEIHAFTMDITKENREQNDKMRADMVSLRAHIVEMLASSKEYLKWRKVAVRQNDALQEDITNCVAITKRKFLVENVLTATTPDRNSTLRNSQFF